MYSLQVNWKFQVWFQIAGDRRLEFIGGMVESHSIEFVYGFCRNAEFNDLTQLRSWQCCQFFLFTPKCYREAEMRYADATKWPFNIEKLTNWIVVRLITVRDDP